MSAKVLSVNPTSKTLGELFTPGGTRIYSCPRAIAPKTSRAGVFEKIAIKCFGASGRIGRFLIRRAERREQSGEDLTYDVFRRL